MINDLLKLIRSFGWKVRYVPHDIIKDYNACYRVMYRGKVISPPAADKLSIPLNEIWLSERLKVFEEYVLFHELREIEYRYQGYEVSEAHIRARVDEGLRFCNDPRWIRYLNEFPDSTLPYECLRKLCSAIGKGMKDREALYSLLTKCINAQV